MRTDLEVGTFANNELDFNDPVGVDHALFFPKDFANRSLITCTELGLIFRSGIGLISKFRQLQYLKNTSNGRFKARRLRAIAIKIELSG